MAAASDPHALPGIRLREYRPEGDTAACVEIHNLIYSPERTTVEQELYGESIYPPDNPRLRYAAENDEGQAVATSACLRPYWMDTPDVYWLEIMVHPD